jgi:hypothetical protein
MNKFIKINAAALITLVAMLSLTGSGAAAGSASLGLSGNGGTRYVGSTFSVAISENSSDPVNTVEADLNYDTSMLQLVGTSCSTGAFEFAAPGSGSGVTCGTATPKTGGQAVGTATFRALAAGSASVNFASSSHIYSSNDGSPDVWNGDTGGAVYNIAAAPPKVLPAATVAQAPPAAPAKKVIKTDPSIFAAAGKSVVKGANNSNWKVYAPLAILLAVLVGVMVLKRKQLMAATVALRSKLFPTKPAAKSAATAVAAKKSIKKPAVKKQTAKKKA